MLAAVLLMQAAAGAPPPPVGAFDPASLSDGSADPTMDEALARTGDFDGGRCGSLSADPFQPDMIIVCGERPRMSYRAATAMMSEAPLPAAERLAPHAGCGVSLNPKGCFDGVAVLRVGVDGRAAWLLDRPADAKITR